MYSRRPWWEITTLFAGLGGFVVGIVAQLLTSRRWRARQALLTGIGTAALSLFTPALEHWTMRLEWRLHRAQARRRRRAGAAEEDEEHHRDVRDLTELLRVVPIAQTRERVDGGLLQLISLEVYAEGMRLHTRLMYERSARSGRWDEGPFGDRAHPELTVVATDDAGGGYSFTQRSSHGGSRESRSELGCLEPLASDATELRVIVAEIRWRSFEPGRREEVMAGKEEGPWIFTVPV